MLDVNTWLLENHKDMVWILNFQHVTLLPSEHRILAGNWLKKYSGLMKERLRCTIMIDCSVWTSMMLKGMFLIAPSPVPIHVLKDMDAARKLLREQYNLRFE
jgi:hypothetical protein